MSESAAQTTSVNVETANVQEPIEVVGGSSPVSWDELSAVNNWRDNFKKDPEVKTAQRRKDEGDDLDEVINKKGENHGEEKSSEEKNKEEVTSDQTKTSHTKTKAKDENLSKNIVKPLKFKNNGQDVEIQSDALVSVKVDGKSIEVPVQEIINRYSQQRHLDDLFKKHKTEREEFDSQRQKMNDVLTKSHELLAQKKDLKGFIELLGENLGTDGQKLYNDAVEKIRQVMEEESTLSPEELRLKRLEEENNYFKQREETAKTQQAEAAKVKALETQVSEILTSKQMSKQDFVEAYDTLIKNGVPADQITPEQVGNYFGNLKLVETIESKLVSVNPELAGNYQEIEKLAQLAVQTQATPEEIDEVIQSLHGNLAAKKLSKKITKIQKRSQAETGIKRAGSDPLFFDEI